MSKTRAFVSAVACYVFGILIVPQPNILGLPIFHIIGIALLIIGMVCNYKWAMKIKSDLMNQHGSRAVLAQRMAQAPTIQKTTPGSGRLTFKQPTD